jgi:hypothetical protein
MPHEFESGVFDESRQRSVQPTPADADRGEPATPSTPDATQLTTFTVLYVDGTFVVARGEWNSPRDGYRAQPGKWVWCGSPGWFANVGRERFDELRRRVEGFLTSRWSDGTWDTFRAPSFPGLEPDPPTSFGASGQTTVSPAMNSPAAADPPPRRRRPAMTRAEARRWSRLSRSWGHFRRSALLDEFTCPLAALADDRTTSTSTTRRGRPAPRLWSMRLSSSTSAARTPTTAARSSRPPDEGSRTGRVALSGVVYSCAPAGMLLA